MPVWTGDNAAWIAFHTEVIVSFVREPLIDRTGVFAAVINLVDQVEAGNASGERAEMPLSRHCRTVGAVFDTAERIVTATTMYLKGASDVFVKGGGDIIRS